MIEFGAQRGCLINTIFIHIFNSVSFQEDIEELYIACLANTREPSDDPTVFGSIGSTSKKRVAELRDEDLP